MNITFIVIVVLVLILAVWQAIQIQALRRKLDSVPDDGDVIAMLTSVDSRIAERELRAEAARQRRAERRGGLRRAEPGSVGPRQ